MKKFRLFVYAVLGIFLSGFLLCSNVNTARAQTTEITHAKVVHFEGAVQYSDGSIINTGTVTYRVTTVEEPGNIIVVKPDGSLFTLRPSWEQVEDGIWEEATYFPAGWEQFWLEDAPEYLWESGYGPWQPAHDGKGVELVESVTHPEFAVAVRIIERRLAVVTVYKVTVTPEWVQPALVSSGVLTEFRVDTNCEGWNQKNDGSFLWPFPQTGKARFRAKVRGRYLAEDWLVDGTVSLLRNDRTVLAALEAPVLVCSK